MNLYRRFNQPFTLDEETALESGLHLRIDQLKERIQDYRRTIATIGENEVEYRAKQEKRLERHKQWLAAAESALDKLDDYSNLRADYTEPEPEPETAE